MGDKEGQHLPKHSSNSNSNHDGWNNHNNNNHANNRSNCNNNCNNDNCNNNDSTNAAKPDIGAWAAIEEIEDDELYTHAVYTTVPTIHQPRVEVELYDSRALQHMSPFHHRFQNFHSIPPCTIASADHCVFYATGAGDLQINAPNDNTTTHIILHDTLYMPDMALTIISISHINSAGCNVNFSVKSCTCKIISPAGKQIGCIPANKHDLFRVEHTYAAADTAPVECINKHTFPCHLCHISTHTICTLMHNHAIKGIDLINKGSPIICDSFEHAKKWLAKLFS